MDWSDVPEAILAWRDKLAEPAQHIRTAVSSLFPATPVGYYLHAETPKFAVYAPGLGAQDAALIKLALDLDIPTLSLQDLQGPWVKVAYSHTLRRAGELLNFFPGQYAAGIPNSPSPVAAMLTSGLVGAGLGYGTGKVLEKVFPQGYGKKVPRTAALIGGLAGAGLGGAWGATNVIDGKPFNDNSLFNSPPPELGKDWQRSSAKVAEKFAWDTMGGLDQNPHAADVNINALGQLLWQHQAPPNLAASTMSALFAAQQMPDRNSRPGWATGHQLAQLAEGAVGDFATGYAVGTALNLAIGTPYSAPAFGAGNAMLGVIGATIPKLFGG